MCVLLFACVCMLLFVEEDVSIFCMLRACRDVYAVFLCVVCVAARSPNLLLDLTIDRERPRFHVKIADFGLARWVRGAGSDAPCCLRQRSACCNPCCHHQRCVTVSCCGRHP